MLHFTHTLQVILLLNTRRRSTDIELFRPGAGGKNERHAIRPFEFTCFYMYCRFYAVYKFTRLNGTSCTVG